MHCLRILAATSIAAAAFAHAADKPCSPADAKRAEKIVDQVTSWEQLQKAWRDWHHCDTGPVAENYTDAVLRLMVDWKRVDALAETLKDPEYKGFIQARLKSPAAKDDQSSIRSRATQSCPKGQDALCAEIAAAVAEAK
jgi:hypothetical protein